MENLLGRVAGGRMMEKLRALLADSQTWLAAASPREKRLLALSAGGVALLIALIFYASFAAALRRAQAALGEKALRLREIPPPPPGDRPPRPDRQPPPRP